MVERARAHPVGIGLLVMASSATTGALRVTAERGVGWIDVVNGSVAGVRCPAAAAGSLLEQIVEMLTWEAASAEVVSTHSSAGTLAIGVEDVLIRADLALRAWQNDRSDFCAGGRRLVADPADSLGGGERFGTSVSEGRDWTVLAAIAGGADDVDEIACQLRRSRPEVTRSVRRLVAAGRVRVRAAHPAHGDVAERRSVSDVGGVARPDSGGERASVTVIRTSRGHTAVEMPAAGSNVIDLESVRAKRADSNRPGRRAFGRR